MLVLNTGKGRRSKKIDLGYWQQLMLHGYNTYKGNTVVHVQMVYNKGMKCDMTDMITTGITQSCHNVIQKLHAS